MTIPPLETGMPQASFSQTPIPPLQPAPEESTARKALRIQQYCVAAPAMIGITLALVGYLAASRSVKEVGSMFAIYGWMTTVGLGLGLAVINVLIGFVSYISSSPWTWCARNGFALLGYTLLVGFGTCVLNLGLLSGAGI